MSPLPIRFLHQNCRFFVQSDPLAQNLRHFLILQHTGKPVCAKQNDVSLLHGMNHRIRLHGIPNPNSARNHVSFGVHCRFLLRNAPHLHQLHRVPGRSGPGGGRRGQVLPSAADGVLRLVQLAAQFGVMSIPTLVVMKQGKAVATRVGVQSKQAILNMLG